VAIYPGTFDPDDPGHEDLVRRAVAPVRQADPGIAESRTKRPLHRSTSASRWRSEVLAPYPNVEIVGFDGC
jgi:pantetheine-phosphate adenylyltransferase